MGKRNKKRQRLNLDSDGEMPTNNAFAALGGLSASLPKAPDHSVAEPAKSGHSAPQPSKPKPDSIFAQKVIVRRQKKGHGGKTVTLIEGVELEGSRLKDFVQELRQGLGTRATIENDGIIVGGDIGKRLESWLRKKGATTIVVC